MRPRGGSRAPRAGQVCGDIDMRIGRDGTWFYRGSPIGRQPLVRLFSTILKRDEAGAFWLETPVEKVLVRVDDAPFIAVEMTVQGSGPEQLLAFRTNVDDEISAGPDHPISAHGRPESGEIAPYILVRNGLEALIARAVYYDLAALGVEGEVGSRRRFGVWSGGLFFPLEGEDE